ncbi:FtsX-like permease family protein [Solibacillus silvestris]|uniref:ABC transporter permease n=1 Tax=Solibacillus silvestris TaxID=76853 RepID=UPI003F7F09A6
MYFRIVRNDILKNKLISLATMLFIAVAAMLVSLAAILAINLSGALDTLMTKAKTPHFMQMHSGEINTSRLVNFAERNRNVDEFQVIEFLNIDGANIILGDNSMAENVQDNGLSIQSEKFDYLLDLDGNIINAREGEIYVPISYMKENIAKIGDMAAISGQKFIVAGFLRDSQMNSTLSASKRFLVNENDYNKIRNQGSIEYLIEFRLKDLSALRQFETAYATAGLEANGPTVTYTLFKMMNAISDGMMIAVILLVSALVVAIAFICIRFTLLAKMEDDYHEIGVLKAIGLPNAYIKKIYFAKYIVIAMFGSIVGFLLSLMFKSLLLENIRLYMGESENSSIALLFGIIGILLVLLAILIYVNNVLKYFKKISVAEAIRFGASQEISSGAKRFSLNRNRLFNTNIFLGMNDVLARKKLYATMLAVLVFASFIIIVPQNLYSTISSKSFTQFMGIGDYDMRIDIQQTGNISIKTDEILKKMDKDRSIANYTALTTKIFKVKMNDGTEENLKIELGDHSAFPIAYSQGNAPARENEIALSSINADEMNKKIGDAVTLVIEGKEEDFIVSGVYSDITNGGKTAKAVFTDNSSDIMWSLIIAEFSETSIVHEKISEYSSLYSYAKVSDVAEYIAQTFGSTINSVEKASYAAIGVSLFITILITLLFMKMLIAKDRTSIAIIKALGFTKSDIKLQYVSRSVVVLFIGIVLGTILANTVGEMLAGVIISSFGVDSFKFSVNPLSAYILSPLIMLFAVLIATFGGISGAGQIKISENIKG